MLFSSHAIALKLDLKIFFVSPAFGAHVAMGLVEALLKKAILEIDSRFRFDALMVIKMILQKILVEFIYV